MNLRITCTAEGVKTYPLHKHNNHEIMLYLEGSGHLLTSGKKYPFSPGTIIIVPPGTEHGSTSEKGFKNISVSGEFEHLLNLKHPVVLTDNVQQDGKVLANLIYKNRYGNREYLSSLCSAYIYFLLQHMQKEDNLSAAINKIIAEITANASNPTIDLTALLRNSDYAEDYIRSHFKKITGKTPTEFLTKIRIDQACFLINVYGNTLTLSQIAAQCGYPDYVYFSKRFKSVVGMSPKDYKISIFC